MLRKGQEGWGPVAGTGGLGGGTSGSPGLTESACERGVVRAASGPLENIRTVRTRETRPRPWPHRRCPAAREGCRLSQHRRVRGALVRRVCVSGGGWGWQRGVSELGPGPGQSGLGWARSCEQRVGGVQGALEKDSVRRQVSGPVGTGRIGNRPRGRPQREGALNLD